MSESLVMRERRTWATIAACGLIGATLIRVSAQVSSTSPGIDTLPATIQFNRDIRPILSDKCFKCHGPGTHTATLRFDLEDGAKHELRGGRFAIIPGDTAN